MKPTHSDVTFSQNCSCTSCTYKSESERPSLKKIVSRGSKIDKLYLAKYIPLRERKLLGKLVRTRAVYDDIRNRLISESSLSISEKADFIPRRNPPRGRDEELADAVRSSVLLELVNLVDKGGLGSRRLSECCSCCGCGSIDQHEHQGRAHTHRQGRPHLNSRSSLFSFRRANYERRKGRHRQQQAKHIDSDPCTCTAQFREMLDTESKKLRGKKTMPIYKPPIEQFQESRMRASRQVKDFKVKQAGMGESIRRSLTKVKRSGTRITKKFRTGTKNSLETIKKTQQKVRDKIKGSARKTDHKAKLVKQQNNISNEKIIANTIKDTLLTYKEGLAIDPNFWTCDFECDPEECEPDRCYEIKMKKHKDSGFQDEEYETKAATKTIDNNIADTNVDNIKTNEEAARNKKNALVQEKCSCESTGSITAPKTKSVKSNTSVKQGSSKASVHKISSGADSTHKVSTIPITTEKNTPAPMSSEREAKSKQLNLPLPITPSAKRKEQQSRTRESSLGFSIDIHKEKLRKPTLFEQRNMDKKLVIKSGHRKQHRSSSTIQSTKSNARSGSLALKRCFCTLKLKPNKNITHLNKAHPNNIKPTVSKSLQTYTFPQTPVLLPYECEPLVCVPGECDPLECLKVIQKRGMHHHTVSTNITKPSKSVSSGDSKIIKTQKTSKKDNNTILSQPKNARSPEQNKQIDRGKTTKQAMRISSSFNNNFYKDGGDNVNSNLTARSPSNTANKKNYKKQFEKLTLKPSQISSSRKSKYTLTKHKLRRCFCTLKLAKTGTNIKKIHSYSRGTLTSGQGLIKTAPIVVDKATEKRERKHIKKYTLLPYECEPGICIPDECDPYKCLSIIKKRKLKSRARQTGTDQRKTKSTYSITRRKPSISVKSVNMQSLTSRQNNEKVTPRRIPLHKETTLSLGASNKQAIRVGSSFSFDIEFYKEKSPSLRETPVTQVELKHIGIKTKMNSKNSQGQKVEKHQKSSSVQSANNNKEARTQSNLKRCFCTLKLHKNAKHKTQMANMGTEVALIREELHPKIETTTKRTNTKQKSYVSQLKSYECEPNFCIPGQCDPNICLERIKIRDKVKSKEFGTLTNKLKGISVSSASDNYKKGKDAMSQSVENSKQIKRNNYTPSVNNSVASTEKYKDTTRQATRIGSHFSFNIEFSKDLKPSKTQDIKENLNVRPKAVKHIGDNFGGKRVKQSPSQTSEIKKITKSTGIRPILKRCFCTRKLQNKKNFPTVMPVLVQSSFSTFYKEELIRFRNLISKQILRNRTYASSISSIFSSTYTESSVYTAHKDLKNYQQNRINEYGLVISGTSLITNIKKENTLIGINQYLKSSFFTMNMRVQNKQKYKHKLEPYECEPGVCVPDHCDPIECQKLIMKRLMRKASTMTSTGSRSQDAYTSSGVLQSKSRKQEYDKGPHVKAKVDKEQQGFKYKTLPRTHKQKQAVRVGSSFSFNIEFFKEGTATKQSPQDIIFRGKKNNGEASSTNTNFKKLESKSTSGSKVPRQHRTSQSGTTMHDKGSHITPKIKRCFCTLKIQKRGRQNKALDNKAKKGVKVDVVKTADAGQNTQKIKPYSLSDLDPNECEPNTCVPGQCDPYECLERIKKRGQRRNKKDFGTDMKQRKMNTSSMTSSQKQASKSKQAHIKEKTTKPDASMISSQKQASKSKQAHIKEKTTKPDAIKSGAPIEKQFSKPSTERQVVRIGSNFSFDIEFFKDKSFPGESKIPTDMPSKAIDHKQTKFQKSGIDKNMKDISMQDSKPTSNQDSQVVLPAHYDKSTKAGSLMQRCFCTLKLALGKQQQKLPKTAKKLPKTDKKPPKTENNAYAQTKKTKTKRQENKLNILKLDPNECEPGVCVPGECDPYICLDRIKKRNALNKMSSTEASGTRSVSTLFESTKVSKPTATNAYTQNTQSKSKAGKPEVKRRSQSEKRAKSSERSAVRIGSNFSFNIEFYKEKSPAYQNLQSALREIKRSKQAGTESSKLISHGATGTDGSILSHDRESQVDHVKKSNKSSNVGMLKRCFCTLALQKHTFNQKEAMIGKEKGIKRNGIKMEMVTRSTETPNRRIKHFEEYKSKPYKLEAYECEPGICIPGECNPYECEKIIKKRQGREIGTKTFGPTSKSATTATKREAMKNHKAQKAQKVEALNRSKRSIARKHEPVKRVSISPKGHARQAVKIGSNFSFDIEFSMNKSGNDIKTEDENDVNSKPVKRKAHIDTQSQPANYRHQKTQGKRDVHHAYSQVLAKKVRSTVTEVAPLLKRCFCTLTLKNEKMTKEKVIYPVPKKKPNMKPTPSKVDKVIHTDQQPKQALDPNECEPGTCIPGPCNPHECLKRIQRRMLSKMSNTDAAKGKGASTITSKPDRTSAKTSTGKYKRQPPRESGDNERTEKRRPSQSPTTIARGDRQVVRIGSNFSFNLEFFKDTSDNNGVILPKQEKNSKTTQHKFQSTGDSQGQNHAASGYRTKLVDRQLQSHGHATESKGSGVGPLMKRCFCTLKLQKVGKLHQKPPKTVKKTKDNATTAKIKVKIDESKVSRDAGTKTRKKHRVLEPYECEPNTCIPGKCNPLECFERIKLRNLNEIGTDAMRAVSKSASSMTDGKGQLKTNQTQLQKSAVTKSTYESTKRKPERSHTADNQNRQSVRLGSSLSFDLEFFKESPTSSGNGNTNTQKIRTMPIGTKSQDSSSNSLPSYNKKQQAHVLHESVGSGIAPLLKRCFCTLTLHNTETNKIPCPKSKILAVSSKDKATSTKKQKKVKMKTQKDLDTHEPSVCSSGKSDPSKGLDHIKKRGIRRQSRTTNTSHKVAQAERIVEQPRFSFIGRNKPSVRFGSNFSFHIEFYKETIPEFTDDPDDNSGENSKNDCLCKDGKKKKNKSKIMNFVCKCLSKANNKSGEKNEKKNKTKMKNYECKCLTVGRVEKIITLTPYKPTQCYVNQVKQLEHARSDDFVGTEMKTDRKYKEYPKPNQQKTYPLPKHIETILPYKPRQFSKNGSNTLLPLKCVTKKVENYDSSYRAYQGQRKEENTFNVRKCSLRKTSSHINLTSKEKRMILPQKSPATALKEFLRTQFIICRNENFQQIDPFNHKIDSLNTADVLKCKNNRLSAKCPLSQPTKSKICKTTVIQKKKYIKSDIGKSFSKSGDAISSKKISGLGKGIFEKHKTTQSKLVNIFKRHAKKLTNYSLFTKKNITLDTYSPPGVMVECARKLSKCNVNILNFHMPPLFNYRKFNYFCKNKDQNYIDTDLIKQLTESSKESKKIEGGVGDVSKDLGSLCICKDLDKTNDTKYKAEGQNCVCDTVPSCTKYLENIKKENLKELQQTNEMKTSKKRKQMKTKHKTSLNSVQHRKSYKKYGVLNQQKKKRTKVAKAHKKYGDDGMKQSSMHNTAKLSMAVVDVLRTTKEKLKEHSATNFLINKYRSRNKKKFKVPSNKACKSSIRKKPWLVFPWFYHRCLRALNIWKQSTELVLFVLAVVVWSPCIFLVEGCKAAKCCTCMSN